MTVHRFFVEPDRVQGGRVRIDGPDAEQIRRVLRLRVGAEIAIFDGTGQEIQARIEAVSSSEVVAVTGAISYPPTESARRVLLLQALLKGEKTDWVVEKATELGAAAVLLFPADRSVVQLREERSERKLERWRRIAKEAAEQSGRVRVPEVVLLPTLAGAIEAAHGAALFLADESLARNSRGPTGGNETPVSIGSEAVLVGPEGGWTPGERGLALSHDAHPISLGPRILRAETAALVALARFLADERGSATE